MTDELPPGWASAPLAVVGTWGSGGTPSRGDPKAYGGSIPWLKIGDLSDGRIEAAEEAITEHGLRNSSAKLLEAGTLLVAMYGSIGKLGITTMPCATNQAIAFCKPAHGLDLRYLFYLLMSERHRLIKEGQGGTQLNISQTILKAHEVPIAPTNEQQRIVSKIDELFSRIEEGERALERVQKLVERYRQSVLKAAVTGELSRDLREKNKDKLESGEALLARILKARREDWEKAELDKMKAKGITPTNDKWKQKYEEPSIPRLGLAGQVPQSWTQLSLEQATKAERPIAYGVLQPGEDLTDGVLMVRVCDVADGVIETSNLKKIAPAIAGEFPRTQLHGGEVLLTLVGTIGRTAIVPIELAGANVARAVGVLAPTSHVLAEWLELCLRYEKTRQLLTENAREVARKTLNLEQLREFATPCPTEAEQHEAISRTSELISKADATARAIERQSMFAKALRQSTLKFAFSGQLVAQDPTDEPAAALLQRISAERHASSGKTKAVSKNSSKEPA